MKRCVATLLLVLLVSATASAQSSRGTNNDDTEPRIVGTRGTLMLGAGGYLDHVYSSQRLLPINFTIEADVGRFITSRIVLRGGIIGSGSRGGDDADSRPTGIGVPAAHVHGGAFYYFTPRSMWSAYSGLQYMAQMTGRDGNDVGAAFVAAGVEGAASSRVHVFVEGAYGMGLTRGTEQTTRVVTYAGLRLRLSR